MKYKLTSFENQIFDHKGYFDRDLHYLDSVEFKDITLKIDVGQFKIGDTFTSAAIDSSNSVLRLFKDDDNGGEWWDFQLILNVGPMIIKNV